MHPFSLEKTQEELVVGGTLGSCEPVPISDLLKEAGGPVTMAIPEDGNDPRPFPPGEWM